MALFSKPVKETLVSFEAKEEKLSEIRNFIRETLAPVGYGEKELTGILLALEEACTNVIRHAYLYGPGQIRLKITIFADRVAFEIVDTGRAFDFESSGSPDLNRYVETSRKGGLGIYLIRKMMDHVDYRSHKGENRLRLSKAIAHRKAFPKIVSVEGISIRKKFAFWMTLILSGLVLLVYFYFENRTVDTLRSNFQAQMKAITTTIAAQAQDAIVNHIKDAEFFLTVKNYRQQHRDIAYIVITGNKAEILANSEDITSIHTPYVLPAKVDPQKLYQSQEYSFSGQMIHHIVNPIFKDNPDLGTIHIGFTTRNLDKEIAGSRRGILIISAISYILGLLAVMFLSNYFVKPIQKLTEGVKRIGSGDLEMKLPVEGADEFSEIARAFNEMTGKIKEAQKNIVEQERMQKELQVAQEIQQTLLPKQFPDIEGYDLATIYRAAKDVGGDYFDFVWIDENTLGIVVADVSGKGVPGSLVMTMIRTAIRLEARGNRSAVDILSRVNDFVSDDVKKGMFITIFMVVLDSINRKISFSSAGHNPMILYRREEDKTYFLNPRGIPLGITLPEDVSFSDSLQAESIKLKKDDILIIYTDGITEAMNVRREQYGMNRLLLFIKNYSFLTPEEFAEKLNEDILEFTEGAAQNDDITLVAIKEKVMADEYLLKRRKRLLELVEVERKSVKEACDEMKVSVSTYYKYKKRFELYGEDGLLSKMPRSDAEPRQLAYEERQRLLEIIKQFPEYGTARLKGELESGKYGSVKVDEKALYEELVRLKLNTKRLRLEFASRQGTALSTEQKEILAKESEKYQAKIAQDKLEYVKKIEESQAAAIQDREKLTEFIDKLAAIGTPEEEIQDMLEMFSQLRENVDAATALKLIETMSRRVTQIELDLSKNKVLDQSRFQGQNLMGWKKVAEQGIDLNLLDNEEESDSFTFKELSKRLEQDQTEKSDD